MNICDHGNIGSACMQCLHEEQDRLRDAGPRPLGSTSTTAGSVPVFTEEEARRGWAMRGNTKYYCCYGTYCDSGHTSDCRYAGGVTIPSEGRQ